MPELIWTSGAARDLSRLGDFLASADPAAARRAIAAIRRGLKTLKAYPEMGRPMAGSPLAFRQWFIRFGAMGYVVIYRYDGASVHLLALRHARESGRRIADEMPSE